MLTLTIRKNRIVQKIDAIKVLESILIIVI